MRSGKWYLLHILLLTVVIGGFFGTGCKKEDAFDNNNVIRTPYPLYFIDKLGAVYNTNDGKSYKLVKTADGVTARSLVVSGDNIMYIKYNQLINPNGTLFLSADNGRNFNVITNTANPVCVWQNQILDAPSMDGNLYLASAAASGVSYSHSHGLTWAPDPTYAGGTVQSFTQLTDGKLYALDYTTPTLYEKVNSTSSWTTITSASPLPLGRFQLAHFNTTLVAADLDGLNGIWFSVNNGNTWDQYGGIPTTQKIYIAASPHDRVLLAGIEGGGVYRLVGNNTFQPSNSGLLDGASVYNMAAKQDIYKNGVIKQYVYIATDKGLYRSEDLGQNWVLMRAGDIRNVY